MRRRRGDLSALELETGPRGRRCTTTADAVLFILDALAPVSDDALTAAADELVTHLGLVGPDVHVVTRLIGLDRTGDPQARQRVLAQPTRATTDSLRRLP